MIHEEDGSVTFAADEFPVAKRGYFMGYMSRDKADTYEYASYRNLDVIKEMAPELIFIAYGPFFPLIHPDEFGKVLNRISNLDWSDPDKLQVYTHEYEGHGVLFFSNHIPDVSELTYEMIADHSECTPDHCTGEDEIK